MPKRISRCSRLDSGPNSVTVSQDRMANQNRTKSLMFSDSICAKVRHRIGRKDQSVVTILGYVAVPILVFRLQYPIARSYATIYDTIAGGLSVSEEAMLLSMS